MNTGSTNNLEKRLIAHNAGKGAKYTSGRRPVELVFLEPHDNISSALRRENQIKKLSRAEKKALINKYLKSIY